MRLVGIFGNGLGTRTKPPPKPISQNLVDDVNSTAFFVPEVKGYQPFFGNAQSAAQVAVLTSGYTLLKPIEFGRAIPVFEVRNELQNYGSNMVQTYCKIKFFFEEGTNAESSEQNTWVHGNDWATKTYQNPNPEKLVTKVEVWCRYQSNYGRERNTRVYRYPSNTNVGYLTLNIPPYVLDEAVQLFEVNIDATREAGDDVGSNWSTVIKPDLCKF